MTIASTAQFEAFKKALFKQANGRFEVLSHARVQLLASQAGLEPDEARTLLDEAARALARGKGYLSRDLLDDAIHDLTMGALLRPDDLDAIHHLALAHQRRWSINPKRGDDQKEAARLARHCLGVDPAHAASFDLLKRLEDTHAPSLTGSEKKGVAGPIVILLLLLVVGGGCLAGLLASRPPAPRSGPLGAIPINLPAIEIPPFKPSAITKPDGEAIPLTIVESEAAEGLKFDVPRSSLSVYTDSAFYRCAGLVRNGREGLIKQATLKLSLLDADGEPLEVQILKAPESHEPALRPGDVATFDALIKTSSEVKGAQIEVQHVEEEAIEGAFAPSRPMTLGWEFKQPEGLDLALRERSISDKVGAFDKKSFYHDAILEVEHLAGPPVTLLKLQVRYLDKDGELLGTNETYALSTSGPEFREGEARIIRSIKSVPARTKAYEVSVIEVR